MTNFKKIQLKNSNFFSKIPHLIKSINIHLILTRIEHNFYEHLSKQNILLSNFNKFLIYWLLFISIVSVQWLNAIKYSIESNFFLCATTILLLMYVFCVLFMSGDEKHVWNWMKREWVVTLWDKKWWENLGIGLNRSFLNGYYFFKKNWIILKFFDKKIFLLNFLIF